jgi:hypothetical protein
MRGTTSRHGVVLESFSSGSALQAAVTNTAVWAFTLAYANVTRSNYDPENRRKRIATTVRYLILCPALKGNPTPTTEAEIDAYLRQA